MADQEHGDSTKAPIGELKRDWLVWVLTYPQRYLEQRRAGQKKQTTEDRAIQSTATATWVIAVFTVAMVFVGSLQWCALHETDASIRGQLGVMERQLNEMKSGSKQTDTLIAANQAVADAAQKSAKVAQDTLIVTTRPWISVTPFAASDLTFDEAGNARIAVGFELENVGNTPAVGVNLITKIIAYPADFRPIYGALSRCQPRKSEGVGNIGLTIFPKQKQVIEIGMQITKAEMVEVANLWNPPPPLMIWPNIIGCVDYRYTYDNEHRQTGFVYELLHLAPGMPFGTNAYPVEDGAVPRARIVPKRIPMLGIPPT